MVDFPEPPAGWDELHDPDRSVDSAGNFLLLLVKFETGGETDVFYKIINNLYKPVKQVTPFSIKKVDLILSTILIITLMILNGRTNN